MPASRLFKLLGSGAFYLTVLVVVAFTLFPFYWAIVTSLKPSADIFRVPVQYWPERLTLEHYQTVLTNGQFLTALGNSALVSVTVVLLSLAVGSMAAYALGRFEFRGRRATLYVVLAMTMFPQIAVLGGLYTIINQLGLFNRLPSLMLSYLLFTTPFTVWVLVQFMASLPKDLEDAAYIDGASSLQTFWRVMLPLALPGLVTTGLLAFIQAWNEFLYALSFIQSPERYTVTRAIFGFQGITGSGYEVPWGPMMAATVVVTVPLVVLVLVFQRWILAGLTSGGVKG